MTTRLTALFFGLLISITTSAAETTCADWQKHSFTQLHSTKTLDICNLSKNKVVLYVNTASECGFTPQFKSLEALYQKYKDQGFTIIGFPSDSFFQEHDEAEKTADVCYKNYGVTFPMVASSKVRGGKANPIFNHLNDKLGSPKWNFYKYLVDKNGKPIKRFGSTTKPDDKDLIKEIEKLL